MQIKAMKINRNTKISKIIRHNPEAIEVIASINRNFARLRNPVLRKVLATRVTVADAARIGHCEVREILDKLVPLGFETDFNQTPNPSNPMEENNNPIPEIIREGKVHPLDVRPILDSGRDPFHDIMKELKKVPEGQAMEIIATFEPVPLIHVLRGKGYISYTEHKGETVHTYFLKTGKAPAHSPATETSTKRISAGELEAKKESFEASCRELDVRNMEMPMPMVSILQELETLGEGECLFVHHKRVPKYLLPELENRQFRVWIAEISDGNVKLLIHR